MEKMKYTRENMALNFSFFGKLRPIVPNTFSEALVPQREHPDTAEATE